MTEERLLPMRVVRSVCSDCLGLSQFNRSEIENCSGDQSRNGGCAFFPYRLGKRVSVKVFRKYCLQCASGSSDYVSECPTVGCQLYPYRFGKNPSLTGKRKGNAGLQAMMEMRINARHRQNNCQD